MMSAEQNRLITQTGSGTPGGTLLRRYWQPIALIEELDGSRPVKAVRVLGQDMVLFRDDQGRIGLIDRDCPHRNADLAFGRLEDGGLRCLFHGWLFTVDGKCIDTPAEPEGSQLCSRITQKSYPVAVRSGIIFGWLGEGEPTALPALDCFEAPDSHVFAFKGLIDCNWLQALEVGIDPAHASFLHRFFEDERPEENYGRQFRAESTGSNIPMTQVLRDYYRPRIEVEKSDLGLRIMALRELDETRMHVRVTNLFFPQAFIIPMSPTMTITQWHVPIDDKSCYWYAIFTSFTDPVDKEEMRRQRLQLYTLPDYRPRVGRDNDYGFSLDEQLTRTYTGMGEDINVHDQWAIESQGHVQDRTREHLGTTDKAIVAYRKLLISEIQKAKAGEKVFLQCTEEEAARITGPSTIDGVAPRDGWEASWPAMDAARRDGAPWRHEAQAETAS